MKLHEVLDEGMFDRAKEFANDTLERFVWNPRYIQQQIMKHGPHVVQRYIVTELPEKQKARIAQTLTKWIRKNPDDTFTQDMKNIVYGIDGTRLDEVYGIGARNMEAQIRIAKNLDRLRGAEKALELMYKQMMITDNDYEELRALVDERKEEMGGKKRLPSNFWD